MRTQTKLMIGVLALAMGSAAFAQSTAQDELRTIAEASGLQVPQIRMLLSNSHTAYTTWSGGYDVSARQLRRAVRDGRIQLLSSSDGAPVSFEVWQKLPERAVALGAPKQIGGSDMVALSE